MTPPLRSSRSSGSSGAPRTSPASPASQARASFSAKTCLGSALLVVAVAGCARAPVERLCPELEVGALVVSELGAAPRGEPSWLELVNATADEVDLAGVGIRMRRLDGGAEHRSLVREELLVGPGAPVVVRLEAPFYAAAALWLESCEVDLDRVTYAQLPARGSLSLGEWPPSSSGNDRSEAWCTDAQGSPAERNQPCR